MEFYHEHGAENVNTDIFRGAPPFFRQLFDGSMGSITIIWESQCHKPTRTCFFLPVKKRKANLGVVGNSTSWMGTN